MKTPMQELIENFNLMSDAEFKAWMLNTDLLEKEKEVICEFATLYTAKYPMKPLFYAKDYYNKTFKTKDCKIIRCEDPMVCLRGCSVHEQTCKHPIYER